MKFGLALKRRCHKLWLMMTAREPLGLSSSGRKLRPSIGCTPRTEKRLAETTAYCTFSGSATPDRLNEPYNDQALISAHFFFNAPATTEFYTLSLHDALLSFPERFGISRSRAS